MRRVVGGTCLGCGNWHYDQGSDWCASCTPYDENEPDFVWPPPLSLSYRPYHPAARGRVGTAACVLVCLVLALIALLVISHLH